MKKIICLFLVSLIMFFSSCSNDENNEASSTSSLTGIWRVENYSDPENYVPCDYRGLINIKEDGGYNEYDECTKSNVNGSWSKSGDNLIIVSDEFPIPFSFKIISLTETTMVLRSTVLGQTEDITYKKDVNSESPPVTITPPAITPPPITETPLPTKMFDYFEYSIYEKTTPVISEIPISFDMYTGGSGANSCDGLYMADHDIIMDIIKNPYGLGNENYYYTKDGFRVSLSYYEYKNTANKLKTGIPSGVKNHDIGLVTKDFCNDNFDLNFEFKNVNGEKLLDTSYNNKNIIDRVSLYKSTFNKDIYYVEGHFDVRFTHKNYNITEPSIVIKGKYKIFLNVLL